MDSFELGHQIGNLDARCARVESTVSDISVKLDAVVLSLAENKLSEMSGKVEEIALSLAEKRGERKVIVYLATAAGGLGSVLVSIAVKLWGHQ